MTQPLIAGTTTQNGLVAESDLTFEAPDNTPDFDLRGAENDFISKLLAEQGDKPAYQDEYGEENADEQEVSEEVAEKPEEPEVEAAPEADQQEEELEDPKLARGIQRVVQRELAAKAEREAADKAIAEMKALKAEMAQYGDFKNFRNIAEMMDLDPVGAMKAMGKDPDTMIKLALAQQMGDAAPDKLKEFAREANTKREIAQLKAQLAAQAQAQRSQEYFNTINAGAREYVTSVGDSTPTLALVAKADPDYARDEIMEEIVAEARRQAAQDPNGEPLAYSEAAKRVETRFARLAKLMNVQNSMNPATKNAAKPKAVPPQAKPAAKPLAPWQKRSSSLEEDGIREALREYDRVEAERKARRGY